ncbi:MAG: hypothetical protein WD004_05190 [Actinomycetota bacterium]
MSLRGDNLPSLPREATSWNLTWSYVAAGCVCLVFGWFAFARGQRVPFLWFIDLGFHEAGHFLTSWAPRLVTLMMGSIFQVAIPVILVGYVLFKRWSYALAAVCLAWAGTSAQNVSVYIADAPYGNLPLIGNEHDWSAILFEFSAVHRAATIAAIVKGLGLVLLLAGIGLCVAGPFLERKRLQQGMVDATAGSSPDRPPPTGGWAIVPPWEQPVGGPPRDTPGAPDVRGGDRGV